MGIIEIGADDFIFGKVALQDVESYQKLLDALEFAQAIKSLRSSLKDIQEGRTFLAEDVFNELLECQERRRSQP